ncbi:ammonium transporter [Guillardia theta CCMP2712]|uniref:Ammonium transporter n=1 Tax=Guillardia theta (strain CCMP2712) TaxID=905079 RepID=L1IXR4_GUITC|nr:ammonium transporter [Guillardia theta CCMP2712]EKX41026.1 ammonium transporter [Guillardia theta CCMP2712]|eukprot:XP_005828006.1 ammonium transporter [Guillardia theta CCMP2712]
MKICSLHLLGLLAMVLVSVCADGQGPNSKLRMEKMEARMARMEEMQKHLLTTLTQNEELTNRVTALEQQIAAWNIGGIVKNITAIESIIKRPTNDGDISWKLISSGLVLMMTIPGVALFYGGLVRVQNVLSTVMQSFSIACLVTILWAAFGYSLCFDTGSPVFGGAKKFWLQNVYGNHRHPLSPTVPEPLFCMFELTFAIITPALISGSFADRMRFGPTLVFIAFWHILVYCPIAHSMWMTDGFLHEAGILDFAGGNVVHISAGCSGLMSSIVVGKRTGYGREQFQPHNILISVLGASLMWVGWFGFNGGSAEYANGQATMAVLNSQAREDCSGYGLSVVDVDGVEDKEATEAEHPPASLGSLVERSLGWSPSPQEQGIARSLALCAILTLPLQLKSRFGYDDALDAFGIHGPGGFLGGILTGFFANANVQILSPVNGAFYGNPKQLYGIAIAAVWSCAISFLLLKLVDYTIGLRVAIDEELLGLDMVCHGESMFPQRSAVPSDWPKSEYSGSLRAENFNETIRGQQDWHDATFHGEGEEQEAELTGSLANAPG